MKTRIFFCLCVVIALIACVKTPRQQAVGANSIGVSGADTLSVVMGNSLSTTFSIVDARNVYAVAALVEYDSTFLSVIPTPSGVLATKGSFLGATGDLSAAFANGAAGQIVFGYSKQGNQPGSDGAGDLWTVAFEPHRTGLTKLKFNLSRSAVLSPNVIGNNLERLPAKFNDKSISIKPAVSIPDSATVYIRITS